MSTKNLLLEDFDQAIFVENAEWFPPVAVGSTEAKGGTMSSRAWRSGCYSSGYGLSKGNSNLCGFWTSVWGTEPDGSTEEYVP